MGILSNRTGSFSAHQRHLWKIGFGQVNRERSPMLMDSTSPSLLLRLRQPGEEASWQRFVHLYTPLLYHRACRMGLSAGDAADLVQDVFVTLVQKLPDFEYDPSKKFRAWLRTITENRWRDMLRRKAVGPRVTGDAGLEEAVVPDGAAALWEGEYREHLLARAIKVMQSEFQPATWKACWALIVQGRSGAEVAAELGMSLDAVYAAKSRVLRRLRQELDGLLD
jgi:RNA polymerase sigma-70 factor (ECF subfamily)